MAQANAYINTWFACQNDCKFCAVSDKRNLGWSTAELRQLIKNVALESPASLTLSGGETTLRNDFFDILSFASGLGLRVILQTTARRMRDRAFAEKIVACNVRDFYVSLHAHEPDLHDSMTQRKGSFWETLEGIRTLLDLGCVVDTNCVITQSNVAILPEYTEWLLKRLPAISTVYLTYPTPVGSSYQNRATVLVNYAELRAPLSRAADNLETASKEFSIVDVPLCIGNLHNYRHIRLKPMLPYQLFFAKRSPSRDMGGETGHTYYPQKCASCQSGVRTQCPGVYSTYIDLFSDQALAPF